MSSSSCPAGVRGSGMLGRRPRSPAAALPPGARCSSSVAIRSPTCRMCVRSSLRARPGSFIWPISSDRVALGFECFRPPGSAARPPLHVEREDLVHRRRIRLRDSHSALRTSSGCSRMRLMSSICHLPFGRIENAPSSQDEGRSWCHLLLPLLAWPCWAITAPPSLLQLCGSCERAACPPERTPGGDFAGLPARLTPPLQGGAQVIDVGFQFPRPDQALTGVEPRLSLFGEFGAGFRPCFWRRRSISPGSSCLSSAYCR